MRTSTHDVVTQLTLRRDRGGPDRSDGLGR
jgi:hypothetical protein